jgi:VCBS repeat-containing protein
MATPSGLRFRRVVARIGAVTACLAVSLPVLESVASAAPLVTVSPATITYTDTSAADTFTEVRGTVSSSSAVSINGGSNSLPNPPNTAVVFYTSGKIGTYGTLWMQNSGAWLYEPNIRAINGATGTVTDTFTFEASDGTGTGSQNLVVTVNGVEDTPALTVVEPPTPASRTVIVVLILAATGFALFIPPVRRRRRAGA